MRLPVAKQVWWWGIAGLVLALALWRLGTVLTPFLLGAGIAYVLNPLADRLEHAGLHRRWAVALITLIVGLLLVAMMLLLVPGLIRQVGDAIESAPGVLAHTQEFLAAHFPRLVPEGEFLTKATEKAGEAISEYGGSLLGTLASSVGNVVSVVATLVLAPVVAFYLLLDWHVLVARLDDLLPREHMNTIRAVATEIDETLAGFLRGQALVTLILGTFYASSLFAVGLPFGLMIGIVAAILSIIPYAGVFLGGVIAIGVAAVHFWGEPVWIGAVAAIFAVGQLVEGNYLQPKIVGGHVGLHPVWLLMALAVFGSLFGFVGLVVAVPLAAMVGVVARFLARRYIESALYTGREVPPAPPQPTLVELVPRGTVLEARRRAEAARDAAVAEHRIELARREVERLAEEAAKESGKPAATATVALVVDPQADDAPPQLVAISDGDGPSAVESIGSGTADPEAVRRLDAAAQQAHREAQQIADGPVAADGETTAAAVALLSHPDINNGVPSVVATSVEPAEGAGESGGRASRGDSRGLQKLAREAAFAALGGRVAEGSGPVGVMAAAAAAGPPSKKRAVDEKAGEKAEKGRKDSGDSKEKPDPAAASEQRLADTATAAADPRIPTEALLAAGEGKKTDDPIEYDASDAPPKGLPSTKQTDQT